MDLVPESRPAALDLAALRAEAQACLDSAKAFLASPVFEKQVALAVLTRIMTDEKVHPRERRRAAEVVGQLQLRAIATVGDLLGVREASLKAQGIDAAPQVTSTTQVVTKVEIVRERDWREATVERVPDSLDG